MQLFVFAVLSSALPVLALRSKDRTSPVPQKEAVSIAECDVHSALPNFLPLDFIATEPQEEAQAAEAAPAEAEAPSETREQKLEVLSEARKQYIAQKVEFKKAEAKLMSAMENVLEVPNVNATSLNQLMEKPESTMVVFYAPWCPHCQGFVLHDQQGDPTKAPLELIRKELAQDEDREVSSTKIVRYDVTKGGEGAPKEFEVQYIPTVYFVNPKGTVLMYKGDHTAEGMKTFMLAHMNEGVEITKTSGHVVEASADVVESK